MPPQAGAGEFDKRRDFAQFFYFHLFIRSFIPPFPLIHWRLFRALFAYEKARGRLSLNSEVVFRGRLREDNKYWNSKYLLYKL